MKSCTVTNKAAKKCCNVNLLAASLHALKFAGSVQFSRFLFPPLVEQNTYINVITLRKKGHATKRNNVVTCKNSINCTSKGNGLHGCII